jgi:hypothetical protein
MTTVGDGRSATSVPMSPAIPDGDVRVSILWKARPAVAALNPRPLTPGQVVGIIDSDLRHRGVDRAHDDAPLNDQDWLQHVHATYYPDISAR